MPTSSNNGAAAPCPCCLLGVPCDADAAALRRAFRAAAARVHPDKGGDVASFHQLQEALQRLLACVSAAAAAPKGKSAQAPTLTQQPRGPQGQTSLLLPGRHRAPQGCCGACAAAMTARGTSRGALPAPNRQRSLDLGEPAVWSSEEEAEEAFARQAGRHLAAAGEALGAGEAAFAEQQLTAAIRLLTAAAGSADSSGDAGRRASETQLAAASADERPVGLPQAAGQLLVPLRRQLAEAHGLRALARQLQSKHAASRHDWELAAELR